ncbi:MAG: glycosyltransferase family 2 protein [Bacteroidales bacterium]|nr:glycosyltransferase family 2 protein [Bacteroidales bacterium]
MKVSVIIPAYNRGKLVIQALESLLLQDFDKKDYEVLVVDNNSKDNTKELITDFVKRYNAEINLKYIQEKRQGDVYARHTGAYFAEGEILFFTDDDATFDTNWISEVYSMFQENTQVGAIGTKISIVWDKEPEDWVKRYENLLGKITYGEGRFIKEKGLFINNGSLAIKRDLFYKVGGNNPGQIGEYLVGDAEVGLCRKIHDLNIPIGFTDRTTMWHHQLVAKNGTWNDIKRRVANNGIGEAYTDIFVKRKSNKTNVIKRMFKNCIMAFVAIVSLNKKKFINNLLNLHQEIFHYKYLAKFVSDTDLIAMMQRKDWVLDNDYAGGELLINNKIN